MSEEEKQAIFEIKKLMIDIYNYMDIGKTRFYRTKYQIILELIDKQQKELQKLEDKINAKIEEIDEEIKVKREIAKNPPDRVSGRLLADSIVELEKTKKVLQSFLERE